MSYVATQVQVDDTSNETRAFEPLLNEFGDDLDGTVITADAAHTTARNARYVVEHSGADLRRWLLAQPSGWLRAVKVVATDLTDTYQSGMTGLLDHARKVADPFHVVRVAQRCLDAIRRRVQNETLGHRGRKDDPLYKIRKILLTGDEHLTDRGRERLLEGLRLGDPNDEVLGGWLAREMVRDVYLTDSINLATVLLGRAIRACVNDDVPEIRSLGQTLRKWRTGILNHHRTGASNGPRWPDCPKGMMVHFERSTSTLPINRSGSQHRDGAASGSY